MLLNCGGGGDLVGSVVAPLGVSRTGEDTGPSDVGLDIFLCIIGCEFHSD